MTLEPVSEFDASKLEELASEYDLCVTGKVHALVGCAQLMTFRHWMPQQQRIRTLGNTCTASRLTLISCRSLLRRRQVFARMTPDRKAAVLTALKENGHFTLMCGDGANDVGALKQVQLPNARSSSLLTRSGTCRYCIAEWFWKCQCRQRSVLFRHQLLKVFRRPESKGSQGKASSSRQGNCRCQGHRGQKERGQKAQA